MILRASQVANKDKWSGPAPEDIEAVESISRLRSLDAWESEDGGTENVTTSGGSTSDASHPILQPTSAVQTSESNNSNTATARAGKKRPKELAPVDGTPFKPQRRSSMRNSLLATVTSAQGSLAIEPQSGNSLPEQPACVTDLEDYQLLERPISRAGSTRQNSNSLQEGGQNSPYGSRKIDLMARGSQAEGNTSSVPINEIAPFQNDGGSQRSLFDSLESSQSDNVGPVGSWGFAL